MTKRSQKSAAAAIFLASSSTTSYLCSSSSSYLMDAMFQLDDNGRSSFLQFIMQSTGAAYICLWSYLAPASCLCSIDGYYQEESGNPSSSSGSLARRMFDEYKKSLIVVENNHSHIPGFAYRSNNPYVETREADLWRMATNNTQRRFYQIVVFMGCRSGEIELGFSTMLQVDLQMQMRNLFPEDFSRQELLFPRAKTEQQNPHSSSSSSMRSLSMDSPEYSSLLFNLPAAAAYVTEPMQLINTPQPNELLIPDQLQALQALARVSNLQFPAPGSEHEVMANAFLAVISSPTSSSSSSQQMQKNQTNPSRASAFGPYSSSASAAQMKLNVRKRENNPMKRAITYFRGLHLVRSRDRQPLRATSTQLHHMMSERKRREKLNDSFLALKSLLPPGTKKDKASVLSTTRDYLTSLKNQVDELREKNAALETQLSASKTIIGDTFSGTIPDNRLFHVRVSQIGESTSTDDHRTVELQVLVRGECPSLQLVMRILEFIKQSDNVQMTAMDSGTHVSGPDVVSRVNLRLRIEGNGWDESAFEEAVRRIVADVAH